MGRAPGGARDAILRAAEQLAAEGGVLAMGVERVVARAGVSKGAFFHHFRDKDEMVAALLAGVAGRFEAAVEARVAAGARFAEALAAETLAEARHSPALIASLVAAVAVDRGLAPIVVARTEAWTARLVADGVPPARARLLRLALDGVLLSSLLGAATDGLERDLAALLEGSASP